MIDVKYNNIINIVWYQALWFVAILGRESYEWLLALLIALHFAITPHWRSDLKTMLVCGGIGITIDSLLSSFGVYVFNPMPSTLPIPLWLMSIWLGFSCTLLHSFTFFMIRPFLGTVIVAAAAPFSYLAGVRFGAVSFGFETTISMVIIAAAWLMIMPSFSYISGRFRVVAEENKPNTQKE